VAASRGPESSGIARRRFLQVSAASALAFGTSGVVTSCAGVAAVAFNPAMVDWLAQLGLSIGAAEIEKLVDLSVRAGWHAWTQHVERVRYQQAAGSNSWYSDLSLLHPLPPVVMFSLSKSKAGDPMTDRLVSCVDTGKRAVVFDAWAWQSLFMFINSLTAEKTGSDLARYRQLCVLTLIPSGTRPSSGRSPAGTVGWMTYESRNGAVEIARVRDPDGATRGIVTAYGIPKADGSPTEVTFTLPTEASETT